MIEDKTVFGLYAFLFILVFIAGWFSDELYRELNNKREVNGLWISGMNKTSAESRAYNIDNSGQWICVNVVESMSYKNIVETCNHEAGHELFARKCGANPKLCFNLDRKFNKT